MAGASSSVIASTMSEHLLHGAIFIDPTAIPLDQALAHLGRHYLRMWEAANDQDKLKVCQRWCADALAVMDAHDRVQEPQPNVLQRIVKRFRA